MGHLRFRFLTIISTRMKTSMLFSVFVFFFFFVRFYEKKIICSLNFVADFLCSNFKDDKRTFESGSLILIN